MMIGGGKSLYWLGIAGLVGMLAMGGCSKKSVVATTSGTEVAPPKVESGLSKPSGDAQAKADKGAPGESGGAMSPGGGGGMPQPGDIQAKADKVAPGESGESRGPGGESPLQGIVKSPKEEAVKAPPESPLQGIAKSPKEEAVKAPPESPLQGIAKSPKEEAVKPPPMVVAKADQAEIDARLAREAAQKRLADIYFAFDKWALTTEGKKNLTQSAEALKQVSDFKLLIEGHCDERGSREYNLVLGEKRAKETERFLLGLGVRNPVVVTSYGKERPVCTEREESCYWKNRRAHLALEDAK